MTKKTSAVHAAALAVLAAGAVLVGAAPQARAEMTLEARNCAARDTVVSKLSANFGETRQSVGLGANNQLVEVFASDKTGTWTITVTTPQGETCLIASGQSYEEQLGEKLAVTGDPA